MKTVAAGLVVAAFSLSAVSAQTPSDGPTFTSSNELQRPENFREWMFVTSGIGMTYNTPTTTNPTPNFTNVYVNPSSYRHFMQTGQWPDKTIFVLEIRASASEGSINKGGNYQTSLVALEASVKDESRFPNGKWAYFAFGRGTNLASKTEALPPTATCYACHSSNGAVDNTFVQFYPTLLDVARKFGTVKQQAAGQPAIAPAAAH
jgi:hypothetical protein